MKLFFYLFFFKIICLNATKYTSLLNDLIEIDYQSFNITQKCKNDLNLLANGLKNQEIWAIKLLDASGRIEPGFIWGNNFWLGSRRACHRISEPVNVVLSEHVPKHHSKDLIDNIAPMPIVYRMVWARHFSKWQVDVNTLEKTVIHIGLCMPMNCNDDDTISMTTHLLESVEFSGNIFLNNSAFIMSSKVLNLKDDYFQQPIVILFFTVLIINIILVIIGSNYATIKSLILTQRRKITFCQNDNSNNSNCEINNNSINSNNNLENGKDVKKPQIKHQNIMDKFMLCYAIRGNSKIITTNSLGSDSIEVIHGMRAIGMVWIIIGHTFFYAPSAIDNLQMILTYAEIWYLQPIFGVAIAVDTFFVISGLVLSYLFFQSEKKGKKENDVMKFLKSIINRLMRLTPPYLIAMIITGAASFYLRDTSQYWMIERNDIACTEYWWRNLLYINNFYPMSDMCMSWSWYLAVDFQCFVITSLFLIIFTKSKKFGFFLFGSVMIAASIFSGYLGYITSYSLSLDIQYNTVDYLYTPTWARIGGYFCGVFAGWFLSHNDRQLKIKQSMLYLCWTIGPLLNLIMIFGTMKKDISPFAAVLYTSLGKITWSIGISWVIVACATGNGGIINRILSSRLLLPFSRMSYTAYLINPICIMFIVMSTEVAVHLDIFSLLVTCFGLTFIVFVISYFFMLTFENPFIRVTKLMQGR